MTAGGWRDLVVPTNFISRIPGSKIGHHNKLELNWQSIGLQSKGRAPPSVRPDGECTIGRRLSISKSCKTTADNLRALQRLPRALGPSAASSKQHHSTGGRPAHFPARLPALEANEGAIYLPISTWET